MPRISGGTNMVGQYYEPQVTPWDREDDDVSVVSGNRSRDRYSGNEFGRDDPYRHNQHHGRDRADADVYNRRGLTPSYDQNNERSGDRRHDAGSRQGYGQYDPARPWIGFREREREVGRRDTRYSQNRNYDWDYDYSDRSGDSDARNPRQGRR